MKPKPSLLWCPDTHGRAIGWKFPAAVKRQLIADCRGLKVVHLFGGQADFGIRLDIDSLVRPHILGDAWLPPFRRDSFDVAILDPPYIHFSVKQKNALLRAAGWISRKRVIWFSTIWIEGSGGGLDMEASWLVRVGDNCYVRCLQYFTVRDNKPAPVSWFGPGPAKKYDRWLAQPEGLPFSDPT